MSEISKCEVFNLVVVIVVLPGFTLDFAALVKQMKISFVVS